MELEKALEKLGGKQLEMAYHAMEVIREVYLVIKKAVQVLANYLG